MADIIIIGAVVLFVFIVWVRRRNMKLWEVHLATPNVAGEFVMVVEDETEAGALSKALMRYPMCYVVITHERK